METNNEYKLVPGIGNSFSTGWKVMSDNFLRLLLVIIVLSILTGPVNMFKFNFSDNDFKFLGNKEHFSIPGFGSYNSGDHMWKFDWGHNNREDVKGLFAIGTLGIFAAFFIIIGMLYSFLVAPVFEYGGSMIFLQAVRKIKPDFEYLVKGFMNNYLTIILANLLVVALIIMGFIALIIPGIILCCRFAFVSFIVMDKKVDPIEAVEMSWKLTKGHGWKIFFMGLASFFIIIFGLCLLIVGIFPAIIWVSSSFASLYESVLREKEVPAEQIAV
jgi:hypothetical protein